MDKKNPEEQLDAYINQIYSHYYKPSPSMSVLVVDNGKAVYKKSFGYANIDTLEKATPDTTYRLSSTSKMFIAMAIIMLKERGQLDFDTKVCDILDDFPEYGKEITIKHLLEHKSGIKDFYNLTGLLNKQFDENNQVLDSDVYEMVKKAGSTNFPPGTSFQYSDTGYIMLGLIVEKVSGMKLSDFMSENIFKPLEMNDTVLYDKTLDNYIPNRAYGAEPDGTKYKFITKDQSYSSATRSDGTVYTSIEDMYKWDQALYTDKLVRKETLKEAYTPPDVAYPAGDYLARWKYTCGWIFLKNDDGDLIQYHSGWTTGFSTIYYRIPEKKRAIVVLSNMTDDDYAYNLPTKIAEIYGFGSNIKEW